MSLAAYRPITTKFKTGNVEFDIRGLNVNDLSILIQTNLENFETLFSLGESAFSKAKLDTLNQGDIQSLASSLATAIPGFIPAVIALVAVEDSPYEARLNAASQLPFPLQVEIMFAVGKLTFDEVGGVKKFLSLLGQLLSQIPRSKITQASPNSYASITESVEM